jgi:hypothetical protein
MAKAARPDMLAFTLGLAGLAAKELQQRRAVK